MQGMANTIAIGETVKRIQPGDYADGRLGDVIEIDAEKGRARVWWHTHGPAQGGGLMRKRIRTWVKFNALAAIAPEAGNTA